ncbi:MAG: hypothetical protein CMN91_12120 [Synechococcus sp. ARS1019]|nr:hypothetical protein [Synechococcus sp. ARS1019]
MAHRNPHPLWQHLPPERRTRQAKLQLQARRWLAWLKQRRQRIAVAVGLYTLLWLIPLLLQQPLITSFALLPLVLVPPVGWLIYWLVWQEFHG